MVSNISPYRPNSREDATDRSDRVKPQGAPRDDSFRKSMRDRSSKQGQEDYAVEDHEEPPSLFDLPKSKAKSKSSFSSKSSLKDSAPSELTQPPVTAKQGREDHEQEPDQDFAKSTSSESETASSDMPKQLPKENVSEDFYAAVEKPPTTVKKPATVEKPATAFKKPTDFEPPSTAVETSPAASEELPVIEEPPTPIVEGEVPQSETLPEKPQPQTAVQFKQPTDPQPQSPMDVLKQSQAATAAIRHPKAKRTDEVSSFETSKVGEGSKKQKTGKSDESKSKSEEGAEVRSDMAAGAVNSSIQSTGFQTEKAPESQEAIRSATIRELAAQIIDHIQVMRKGDETQTTVTLRHPDVLKGATITLIASDHAKREFNIAFGNLSVDAKLLLDRKLQEDSLTETLKREGIVVHMLTTSTQETAFTVDTGQASRDRQEQQQQQQQRQKQQNFQSSEDEEVT